MITGVSYVFAYWYVPYVSGGTPVVSSNLYLPSVITAIFLLPSTSSSTTIPSFTVSPEPFSESDPGQYYG